MTKRPLTLSGGDVAPILRRANGRAVVVFLDRHGRPTTHTAEAWPHELRGVGWHIAAIKHLFSLLPLDPSQAEPLTTATYRPLHLHRVAEALDRKD